VTVRASVQMTLRTGEVLNEILEGVVRGQNAAAERLLALSREQVPFDEGTLSGSGAVVPAESAEQGAAVTYDTPYAARLHEHPEYHFSTASNPGAKGKYLEDPALENRKELGAIIRREARADG